MTPRLRIFLIVSICFSIFCVFIDLKNYLENEDFFVVSEDIFDKLKFYLSYPGMLPTSAVVLIIYKSNFNGVNPYVLEGLLIIFNSIIYGALAALYLVKRGSHLLKNNSQSTK